jgi:hypothetical protein
LFGDVDAVVVVEDICQLLEQPGGREPGIVKVPWTSESGDVDGYN